MPFYTIMNYLKVKKQAEFQRIFNKGKRVFSPTLTVLYRPSKKTSMGISVGKRHGKSVQRNRVKRLLREAFRANVENIRGEYDFVLIPKVLEEYSLQAFDKDLRWIIKKENL